MTSQRRNVSYSPLSRSIVTRTSMSPPWRFLVADASAASRASKMMASSTPFSFETASTTSRMSLLIVRLV